MSMINNKITVSLFRNNVCVEVEVRFLGILLKKEEKIVWMEDLK